MIIIWPPARICEDDFPVANNLVHRLYKPGNTAMQLLHELTICFRPCHQLRDHVLRQRGVSRWGLMHARYGHAVDLQVAYAIVVIVMLQAQALEPTEGRGLAIKLEESHCVTCMLRCITSVHTTAMPQGAEAHLMLACERQLDQTGSNAKQAPISGLAYGIRLVPAFAISRICAC